MESSCTMPKLEDKKSSLFSDPAVTLEGDYELKLHNVPLYFPFEPYQVQVDFMGRVIEAFKTGTHGLLESPTGTGKTLSLLCSALAYTEFSKSDLDELEIQQVGLEHKRRPTVIYASRTHSQLGQVIQELKRTRYNNVQISVLGARDNLCVNPHLRGQSGVALREQCSKLVAQNMCAYHSNLQRNSNTSLDNLAVMDIEEMGTYGKQKKLCPYYLNRERSQGADVVFMPYNFLVDPKSRGGLSIVWEDACVIIDEAHNIQQSCDESASASWSTVDMSRCAEECQTLALTLLSAPDAGHENEILAGKLTFVKQVVEQLISMIDKIELRTQPGSGNKGKGMSFPGDKLIHMFKLLNLDAQFAMDFRDLYEQLRGGEYDIEYMPGIGRCMDTVSRIFVTGDASFNISRARQHFRCYVEEESTTGRFSGGRSMDLNNPTSFTGGVKPRTIHFWCFSPGVTLQDIVNLGVKSVVLTSGTLAPLPSFAFQMQQPFPVTLENSHVVDMQLQVWLGVVGKGVTGKALNSRYDNRTSPEYLDELGNTIANFVRIVPDGLLVFFPSYAAMNLAHARWESNKSLWTRIIKHKQVFVEPRGMNEMKKVVENYEAAIKSGKGSMFFAVCRGKASEGIDFSNTMARAVVLTGLPFPPLYDPKVVLKKQYLDGQPAMNNVKVSGQEWYTQEAIRAINQALGRVIRHKDDYGAMILLDERFASPRNHSSLSKWLQPSFHVCKNFGQSNAELVRFFRTAAKTERLKPKSDEGHVTVYQEEDELFHQTHQQSVQTPRQTPSSWVAQSGPTESHYSRPKIAIGFDATTLANNQENLQLPKKRKVIAAKTSIASLTNVSLSRHRARGANSNSTENVSGSSSTSFADTWMAQHSQHAPGAVERVKRRSRGGALAMSRIRAQEQERAKLFVVATPKEEQNETQTVSTTTSIPADTNRSSNEQIWPREHDESSSIGTAMEQQKTLNNSTNLRNSNLMRSGDSTNTTNNNLVNKAKPKTKIAGERIREQHKRTAIDFVKKCKICLPTDAYKSVKKLIRNLQTVTDSKERGAIYDSLHMNLSRDRTGTRDLVDEFELYIENPVERQRYRGANG